MTAPTPDEHPTPPSRARKLAFAVMIAVALAGTVGSLVIGTWYLLVAGR